MCENLESWVIIAYYNNFGKDLVWVIVITEKEKQLSSVTFLKKQIVTWFKLFGNKIISIKLTSNKLNLLCALIYWIVTQRMILELWDKTVTV